MYCKNCGAFVDDRCYYCGNCKSPTEKEVHWNAYDKQNTYCFNPNSVNTFDVENDRLIENAEKFSFLSIVLGIMISGIVGMVFSILSNKKLSKIPYKYKMNNLKDVKTIKFLNACGFIISFLRFAYFAYVIAGFFAIVFLMDGMS